MRNFFLPFFKRPKPLAPWKNFTFVINKIKKFLFDFEVQGQSRLFLRRISIRSTDKHFLPSRTEVMASRRLSLSNRSKNIQLPVYVRFPYTSNTGNICRSGPRICSGCVKGTARTQERITPSEWEIPRKGPQAALRANAAGSRIPGTNARCQGAYPRSASNLG